MKKRIALGTGVISLATCAFFFVKYYANLQEWKKERIENAYYKSRTEKDVIWG